MIRLENPENSKTAKNSPRAFTFVELLISAGILAVVLVVIYSSFFSGVLGSGRIRQALDAYQACRLILRQLNLDLRNSFIYSDDDTGFSGGPNTISFVSLPEVYVNGAMQRSIAFVSYEMTGGVFSRLCRRGQEAFKVDSEITPKEFSREVTVSFQYGFISPVTNQLEFKDDWAMGGFAASGPQGWDENKVLPHAVKVSVGAGSAKYSFERLIYLPLAQIPQ